MKRIFLFISIINLMFLLAGCGKEALAPNAPDSNMGKLGISFDKASCPQDVITITATLSRTGYTAIIKQLDITSSSSAEITIDGIMPGTWHLKVNACDAYNTILYAGESDVTILQGVLTTAALVLKPIGQLQIKVSWGTVTTISDYQGNPILTKNTNGSPYGPYFGRVLYDGGKFKMWFANSYGSDRYDIGYAESADGFTWTIIQPRVLTAGSTGEWDCYGVHPGAIIKDGSVYKMYYCGQSLPNNPDYKRVGLATSSDGINWVKSSLSVVNKINISGYSTDIIKYNNTYFLYYGNQDVIGVAMSTDGLNWTKGTQSIITANQSWEGSRIWSCSVIYDDDSKFKMLYTNSNFDSFGYAESTDGINWTKRTDPFFTYNNTNNLWPYDIRYPFLRKVGTTYYIYYSTVYSNYECKIGVATSSSL